MYTAAYVCLNPASWLLYTPIKLLLLLLPNNLGISDTSHQQKTTDYRQKKQAVGGRPPRYAPPRPATEARSGSLEPARPSRARSANTRHPAGRPHTPPADRMYATDVRQTDVRQHHRLMPLGRGITTNTHTECKTQFTRGQCSRNR